MKLDPRVQWGHDIPADDPIPGVNERCIEIPLGTEVLAFPTAGRVLDAGCAMNGHVPEETVVADVWHLTQHIASEHLVIPTARSVRRSYLSCDLRDLPFRGGLFDRVVCISTLEHVGMDNQGYGGETETNPASMLDAVYELFRVTKRDLLLTVPYADPAPRCAQWRFLNRADLHRIVVISRDFAFRVEVRFYAKTEGGWYGGGQQPVPASPKDFPQSVNAIACLRFWREH